MLTDARALPDGSRLHADVCIVGGGAAGLTIAQELARHRLRVVLLESGTMAPRRRTQQLCEGAVAGRPYYTLDACRFRALGGSTTHWGGWCRPLDAIDFEAREWIPHSGWPFAKQALDTLYARAHVACRLGPYDYDPRRWHGARLAHRGGADDAAFQDVVFQIQATRFGAVHGAAARRSRRLQLFLNANVVEVVMDRGRQAALEVRAATAGKTAFAVAADLFVLAAGGIENARIMLASRRRDRGIGNENDLVGRYFADHLHVPLGLLRPRDATAAFYRLHERDGVALRGGLGLSERYRRLHRRLGFAATLHDAADPADVLSIAQARRSHTSLHVLVQALRDRRWPDSPLHHLSAVVAGAPELCRLAYRRGAKRPPRTLLIGCRAEQAPNPDSRITLDGARDWLGMPKVRLEWRLGEQDLESIRQAQDLLASALRDESIEMFPFRTNGCAGWIDAIAGGAHHMGTTRMHRDARYGVVDENCRVHGTANLYVAGSSVFPTGGWAPPTLTIVALAVRLADHLIAVTAAPRHPA